MKLTASIDLEPLRKRTLVEIDRNFVHRVSGFSPLYAAKLAWTEMDPPPEALVAEAELKGIPVSELCKQIRAQSVASQETMQKLEIERQNAKARVMVLNSEQELRAMLQTYSV